MQKELTCHVRVGWLAMVLLGMFTFPLYADVPAGDWELIWSDEFDGTSIDDSLWDWGQLPWGGQHHNDEYASWITAEDSYLSNGSLILRCREASGDEFGGYPYSEGMVYSHAWMTYGYMEIRARHPLGNGVWPAFWMLSSGWPPEFDIAEYFGSDDRMHMGYCWGPDWTDTHWDSTNLYNEGFETWHVYGLEWGPNYAKWSMDGVQRKTFTGSDVTSSSMYILLNSGMRYDADSSTPFPNYYEVDYFRWYQENELPTVLDDDDASISYSGTWGTWSGNPGYNQTEHYSETTGSTATFTFTGTKARYYGFKRDDLGYAEILVDGQSVDTVDCYSSVGQYFALLYETPLLTSGTHTLAVRVTGTQNASSSGTEIIVDAFGYLVEGGTPDTDPPSPDPMTWATVPYATGAYSIAMEATTATDASGVQYYFTCTAGGGNDSGWQSSPSYEDTGLTPETQYTYTVTARDTSSNQNQAAASTAASATTDASSGPVTLLDDSFELDFANWTDGGNTDWDRTTSYAVSGNYSAHAGSRDNDLISDNLDTTAYSSIDIEFWYRDDDIDDGDNIYAQLYDGSSYINLYELGNSTEDTWHQYQTTLSSSSNPEYFHSTFRIKFEGSSIDNRENLWIDDVLITAE